MHDISHLNERQREAVTTTEGPLLVLAGAGSGKTAVLTERCAMIIRQGTPPWAVLAITFTNKAAKEIKERLVRLLGKEGGDVWAMTFHAACVRILRREIAALGYNRSFTVYDTDDQKRVMKEVLKTLNIDEKRVSPQAVLSLIGKAKDSERDPKALAASAPDDYFTKLSAECYALYQKRLFDANALDFDDILALTVRLFRQEPEVLRYYQRRFSYILIDEYQDTNMLQYSLVSMLAAGHRNLCVVGDDDQSIYGFRGATIENILSFEKHYPEAKVVRLEQNYRSTGAILDTANRVIAKNMGRKGKTLWTGNGPGDPVRLTVARSENEEARFISETVLSGVSEGASYRDYCILYRMNAQSGRLETQLRMSGIPYKVVGGTRFYDRAEVKDMMAYLQIIHNPHDDLRLTRIINTPARGIGGKGVAVLQAMAARDGVSCFEVAEQADTYPELGRLAKTLTTFTREIRALGKLSGAVSLTDFYDAVLETSGYAKMLRDKDDEESRGRLENVMELKSSLQSYQENAEEASLGGFLDETALFTDLDKYEDADNTVTLMTIHAAKGLEFPSVFLVGMEEGIFPGSRSFLDPAAIEEERRLCYVAVTRAEKRLYVLCAEERLLYGQTSHNPPSRFIAEMGLEPAGRVPCAPAGSPFSDLPFSRNARRPERSAPRKAPGGLMPDITPEPSRKTAKALTLAKGDTVTHKRFGRGLVLTVTPMGDDAMLEIAFDENGTRKLMRNFAAPFLEA
ncbi:MAG: UvrD-helicase domain-containing protein [Oscillospiraceae bacterium]|jgi:DNA helicase-2/ATP-dependent DNA helicase PcrA|nr:UvrD-helicase domain-containing protein [Oscillospiraceae bacterium]